jgi:hypothetical protein
VIDNIYWAQSPAEKALAALVGMDAAKKADVTMTKILAEAGAGYYDNENEQFVAADAEFTETNFENNYGQYINATVAGNSKGNDSYYNHLYKFQTTSTGTQIVAQGIDLEEVEIVTGKPNTLGDRATVEKYYATNNNTAFLVKTLDANGNPVYTSYTGIDKVPSMDKVNICYFVDSANNYVSNVYVDATKADFAVTRTLAVIFDDDTENFNNVYAGFDGTRYGFEMWTLDKDGKMGKTVKYVSTTVNKFENDGKHIGNYAGFDFIDNGTGLYEVACDANGYVVGLKFVGDEFRVVENPTENIKGNYDFVYNITTTANGVIQYVSTYYNDVHAALAADVKYYEVKTINTPSYLVTEGTAAAAEGKTAIVVYNATRDKVTAVYYMNIGYSYKEITLTKDATVSADSKATLNSTEYTNVTKII